MDRSKKQPKGGPNKQGAISRTLEVPGYKPQRFEFGPEEWVPPQPESKPQRLDTEALLVEELTKGLHYQCLLANGRRVQYVGEAKIKWYSPDLDEYRIAEVHDYQLKKLEL